MARKKVPASGLRLRGFLRGQIVDHKTGKVVGDTGWRQNKATNEGLKNLALRMTGAGYAVGYAAIGVSTGAINMTQTDLQSRENSFQAISTSTSGTCTATFTCSFAGSNNSDTLTMGEAGLFKTNSAGSLIAAAVFTGSQMTTDQDFNLNKMGSFIGNDEKETVEIAGTTLELQLLIAELEHFANSENVEDWSISREAEKSEPSETIMAAPVINGMKI